MRERRGCLLPRRLPRPARRSGRAPGPLCLAGASRRGAQTQSRPMRIPRAHGTLPRAVQRPAFNGARRSARACVFGADSRGQPWTPFSQGISVSLADRLLTGPRGFFERPIALGVCLAGWRGRAGCLAKLFFGHQVVGGSERADDSGYAESDDIFVGTKFFSSGIYDLKI